MNLPAADAAGLTAFHSYERALDRYIDIAHSAALRRDETAMHAALDRLLAISAEMVPEDHLS